LSPIIELAGVPLKVAMQWWDRKQNQYTIDTASLCARASGRREKINSFEKFQHTVDKNRICF